MQGRGKRGGRSGLDEGKSRSCLGLREIFLGDLFFFGRGFVVEVVEVVVAVLSDARWYQYFLGKEQKKQTTRFDCTAS